MASFSNRTHHYRKLLRAAFIPLFSLVLWLSPAHVFAAKSLAASECARLLESYADRPAILEVEPKRHPQLNSNWAALKKAHLEAVAQLIEMYPHEEIYFLARDSELLYDMAMLMTQGEPSVQARLHLVNVSRANMRHAELKAYLEQEGLTSAKLASGQRFLFVDTGLSGSIPNEIQQLYPREMRAQLRTHLISSSNPNHPSTRVFLTMLNREAANRDPFELYGTILDYENIPRHFDRSTGFERRDGKLHPVSPKGSQVDGSVSKEVAKQYMEDLSAFAGEKAQKNRFQQMRQLWRELYGLASWGQKERLVQKLSELVATHDPFHEAVVRDFVEILQRNHPQNTEGSSAATLRYELVRPGTGEHRRVEFTEQEWGLIQDSGSSLSINKLLALRRSVEKDLKAAPALQKKTEELKALLGVKNVQKIGEGYNAKVYLGSDGFVYKIPKDAASQAKFAVEYTVGEFLRDHQEVFGIRIHDVLQVGSHYSFLKKPLIQSDSFALRILKQPNGKLSQIQTKELKSLFERAKYFAESTGIGLDLKAENLYWNGSTWVLFDTGPRTSYLPYGFTLDNATFDEFLETWARSEPISRPDAHSLEAVTNKEDLNPALRKKLGLSEHWQIAASYQRKAPTTVSLQDLSLSEIQGSAVENQELSLAQKRPEWAPILEDPQTKIPELLKAQDFGRLGALMEIYFDHEFYQLVFQNLGKLNLEHTNAHLGGFLKAIPEILKNHFQTAGKQVTQLVALKAPKRVMLEHMREGDNLKTSLMSSKVKVKQAAVDAVFTAANQREEFAGFRFLSERPETEWADLAKDYLYYTGGQERLTRDLLESFSSTDPNLKRFAEQALSQVDSKEYPFKEVLTDIQRIQEKYKEQYNYTFEDASRAFLEDSAVPTERKTGLILSQMGMKGSKFQEYLDYVSGAERQDILGEIDRRTGLGPYLKLAQEKGVLSFFIEHTKLESVSFHTFTFPKKGKTYTLGSPENEPGRSSNETQRKVTMKESFALGKTETTQLEYALVMEDNPSKFTASGIEVVINGKKILVDPTRPVENVSYKDTEEFHRRMSLIDPNYNWDLPTESRWEVAAREGAKDPTDAYWFGNDPNEVWVYARTYENSYGQNHPVAQKPGDRNGLRDMSGLNWEWTKDWYTDVASGGVDPEGPSAGSYRVMRGGSWSDGARGARSAGRSGGPPDGHVGYLGFRSVRTPK